MIALMLLPEEDRDRIGRLWSEYGGTLIERSLDLLGSAATYKNAEDIVSEAFIKLIEHYERYGGRTDEQMKAILLRTCTNLCINEYRRGKRITFQPLEEEENDAAFPENDPPAPEDLIISEEAVVRLKDIVKSLGRIYREVLEMKILEELPDAAIAEELGIPAGTVRTRLRRARRLVIEKWEEEEK
ncbi:MAG: sigma-70 family RNA polymerase sigma factor [Clostridia bacterium]|nr:sigma-70 family RNA polymerase sigma factor [Clostridia bacterium]